MLDLKILTAAEQVAEYIREQLRLGVWIGSMPGGQTLASELGVGRMTVEAALVLLEEEGILINQGVGRRRLIELPVDGVRMTRAMKVAIFASGMKHSSYAVECKHQLIESGYEAFFTEEGHDFGKDFSKVARFVRRTKADAWIVGVGSQELLRWFESESIPVMALFGRLRGVNVAGVGPNKPPEIAAATRRLVELGHRRIVLMTSKKRRLPKPGASERAFLSELENHGQIPSTYNLPDWETTKEGVEQFLDSLFKVTPPTALIVDEAHFFLAVQQHLARKGIVAPEDISLVCTDPSESFEMFEPPISHINWDIRPVVRRIVRWADNVNRGREDRRQTFTKAEFIEGGTIGPVPKK